MTETELAGKVGISKELLSHYLNTPLEGSRIKVARKISEVTGGDIPVSDFYPSE